MHTNKDGRRDECMLMCYVRNTWKELPCKFNQEQNQRSVIFLFFFSLFFWSGCHIFHRPGYSDFFSNLQSPTGTTNATTCNTPLYKRGSCSETKTTVQYFCSSSSFGRTEYFTCYLTLLKEYNISSAALLKDVFFFSLSVFVLLCLGKRAHLHRALPRRRHTPVLNSTPGPSVG